MITKQLSNTLNKNRWIKWQGVNKKARFEAINFTK